MPIHIEKVEYDKFDSALAETFKWCAKNIWYTVNAVHMIREDGEILHVPGCLVGQYERNNNFNLPEYYCKSKCPLKKWCNSNQSQGR